MTESEYAMNYQEDRLQTKQQKTDYLNGIKKIIEQKNKDQNFSWSLSWCGKCQALRKLLIRVFSLKTEAIAEVCPVSYPTKKADRLVCLFVGAGNGT